MPKSCMSPSVAPCGDANAIRRHISLPGQATDKPCRGDEALTLPMSRQGMDTPHIKNPALRSIKAGVLRIAYQELGPAGGRP